MERAYGSRTASLLVACCAALLVTGCAAPRPTVYGEIEVQLGTRGGLVGEAGLFHDVVYNPESITLNFPGYLVGIDKGRRHAVQGKFVPPEDRPDDQWGISLYKSALRHDPKLHYISHIVRNTGRMYGEGNCVLYSVYQSGESAANARPEQIKGARECSTASPNGKSPFDASDDAVSLLRKELADVDPASYTHVLVVVMGWNTPQVEAVQNFNSVASHIRAAATFRGDEFEFRPLFIGITWASLWSSSWLEPLVRGASYPSKAHDADEVGLGWLGTLLDAVVAAVPPSKPKVAIGHSFGARALSSALCGYPKLTKSTSESTPPWDLFVGWQPAVSINRFKAGGGLDGFTYKDGCSNVATLVFTASEHDHAAGSGFWADMLGSGKSWEKFCHSPADAFLRELACISAEHVKDERLADLPIHPNSINYLNAKHLVWFNQPNTGGGAHSDVYRAVHGRLNWISILKATR